MVRGFSLVGALVLATLVVAAPATAVPSKTSVTVTAGKPSEFKFVFSKTSLVAGSVFFSVTNKGKLEHDFKIAGKKTVKLKPGSKTNLTVVLKAGKAAYLCTLPGHAAGGMKGTLTVK